MNIISIVNGKGGVGKTASSINLSAGLTLEGYRVLLIDLDKQGNTTKHFKLYDPKKPSIVEVIIDGIDPRKAIRHTDIENLDVLPSIYELEDVPDKILLDLSKSREKRLKEIKTLDYDYVIIDCPPDLGIVTINALSISDYVLVPMIADMWSLEGFDKITKKIDIVRDNYNSQLKLLGVFVTLDKNTLVNKQIKDSLKVQFKDKFLDTSIRQSEALKKSTFNFVPVVISDPKSTVAIDYRDLVLEVIKNV